MVALFRSPRSAALLLPALLVAPLVVTACRERETSVTVIEMDVELESANRVLHKVGPDDRSVYGWNHLMGTSTVDGKPVQVEMQGEVDYTNGGGDFAGFITFTFDDGSTVGVSMVSGEATAKSDTSNARFSSLLRVIGGTGAEVNASGRGTFVGERDDTLGGVVKSHFVLRLKH